MNQSPISYYYYYNWQLYIFFLDYWLHYTSFLLFIMQSILTTTTIHLHFVCIFAVVVIIIIVSVDQLHSWRLGCRHLLVLLAGGVMLSGLCDFIHAGLGMMTIMMRSNIYINPLWNNKKRTNVLTTVQYCKSKSIRWFTAHQLLQFKPFFVVVKIFNSDDSLQSHSSIS